MSTFLLNTAIVIVATVAGVLNARATYRPIPDRKPVRWAYVAGQVIVAVVLICTWLWWIDFPLLAIGAVAWTAAVPAHIYRAIQAALPTDSRNAGDGADLDLTYPADH